MLVGDHDQPGNRQPVREDRRQLLSDHLILLQYATSDTEDLFVTEAERREVVARLVEAVAADELAPTSLAHADPALLLTTDLPWVLERLTASLETEHERVWALLADQLWTYADDASAAAISEARETSTELESLTAPRFEAVRLDSPLAEQNRKCMSAARGFSSNAPSSNWRSANGTPPSRSGSHKRSRTRRPHGLSSARF